MIITTTILNHSLSHHSHLHLVCIQGRAVATAPVLQHCRSLLSPDCRVHDEETHFSEVERTISGHCLVSPLSWGRVQPGLDTGHHLLGASSGGVDDIECHVDKIWQQVHVGLRPT